MNFDDLFGLLLFVVFIALPALSRLARSKNKSGGGAAPTQGAPGRGRASTAQSARPAAPAAGGGTATTAAGGDDLERRLAAARERVRRALERQGGASSAPTSGQAQAPVRPAPLAPGAARPTAARRTGTFVSPDRDDGLLSTPLEPVSVGLLGRARAAAQGRVTRFAEAPALQIERPGLRAGPRAARAAAAFATDPETIRSAILWHQVLGEPRARRPLGGRPSTLRSR